MISDINRSHLAVNCTIYDAKCRITSKRVRGWKRDLRILLFIFFACTVLLTMIIYFLIISQLNDTEWSQLRFPSSLKNAQQIGSVLTSFSNHAKWSVLFTHMCCYLYGQTFAIPGSIFLNLLGGALFGLWVGFPLCVMYNTIGSLTMYLLSQKFGERIVSRFCNDRLMQLKAMIDSHTQKNDCSWSDLALYTIFMRIFPFTPNWFLNIASPHLKIPIPIFILGPFFGLIPYNFLSCQAGLMLSKLKSKEEIVNKQTTFQLVVIAVLGGILLPILKKRFRPKQRKE
uniref:SNARE associated Golgi protein putative n=1 Tax=Albugo laibachii Nc14 TaxID=890382 RepID=F0VYY8_9STRA|nr:SNARE associated Golgi protein putative [Albugo laibachii Nc14]|eukprot:CCA14003.1 SNARE associated Golgi protein putative [Albugo laibachii Nc14]